MLNQKSGVQISILGILISILLLKINFGICDEEKCKGVCKPFSKCNEAQELLKSKGIHPQICHFDKTEPYVCCPNMFDRLFRNDKQDRISKLKCEDFYPVNDDINIVAGVETDEDEYPFMAVVGFGDFDDAVYNCGGILIEKNFVITAAHCGYYNGVPASAVRIGGNPLADKNIKPIRVIKVILHPNYNSSTELNDIAILVLGENAKETPACLWTYGELNLEYNSAVVAAGYGSTSFGGAYARRLLKVYLNVVDINKCIKDYPNKQILNSQLCVAGNERVLNNSEIAIQDTCQGDSGGPLMIRRFLNFRPKIIGVVSYGNGCGTKIPGIYTNITTYLDWIESIIWPINGESDRFVLS